MSQQIQVNRITNGVCYVNGTSLLGKVETADLPDVKAIMSEHKALGMVGKFELFAGIEKMEMKVKWNSFYKEVAIRFYDFQQSMQLQVRSNVETHNSSGLVGESALVTFIQCTPKNIDLGKLKQHDNVEMEQMFNVTAIRQLYNGQPILEIDILANIFRVNGIDQLANYRANTGG